jgi:NAD(P)-dependent dehydrogenase (short-subunit alcohol dehydrogenase family)
VIPAGPGGRFRDKVALVTGGASGIGAASARAFADEGAAVVVIDLEAPSGEALGPGVTFVVGDVTDPSACERAIAVHGRVDVMFANAGISADASVLEIEMEEWQRVLDVNLTGAFLAARAGFRAMVSGGDGGAIVLTSSPHALRGDAGNAHYAASKAGLLAVTRAMAVEGAAEGVRVNAVLPGAIDTPMVRTYIEDQADPGAARDLFAAASPMNRLGRSDEIASAVLFLASDAASFVTGVSLAVDGGLLARM